MQRQVFRTFSRGFAAAAAAAPKTGRRIYSPAGAYAHSLLEACVEEKADPKAVAEKLFTYTENMDANTGILKRFMEDTQYTWEEKTNKLDEHVFKEIGLGGNKSEDVIAREMVSVAMEEGVSNILPEIAVDFEMLALDHIKEVKSVVTSAVPLTAAQTKEVNKKLQSLVKKGETLTTSFAVDPSIIGGLTLQIADKFQDLSVRSAVLKGEKALRAM